MGVGEKRRETETPAGEGGRTSLFCPSGMCLCWGASLPLLEKRGNLAFPSPKPEGPPPLPWAGVGAHVCGGKGVNQAGSRCCI